MSYYQYRFRVNGTTGNTTEKYDGAKWTHICETAEQHGFDAFFDRRLVTDMDILPLLGDDRTGYIVLENDGLVVCPWDNIAHALFQGS